MSPSAAQRKPASRKKKKKPSGWWTWWPLLLGILVTPLTVRAAGVMALAGPDALRTLYPYVLLLQSHALGLPGELANAFSQGMMYLQFPLYGLLMALVLRRRSLAAAVITAVLVHFAGVAVVLALAHA